MELSRFCSESIMTYIRLEWSNFNNQVIPCYLLLMCMWCSGDIKCSKPPKQFILKRIIISQFFCSTASIATLWSFLLIEGLRVGRLPCLWGEITAERFLYLKTVTVGKKLCSGEPWILSKPKCIIEKSLIHNFEMLHCHIFCNSYAFPIILQCQT